MANIKTYEAYVADDDDLIEYFESKLDDVKDVIKNYTFEDIIDSKTSKPYRHYVIEAEEGYINPKYEVH